MTLFMPPIQRKKKVEEKYNPDTYRVISEDAVSDHPKYRPLPYRASFEPPTPVPKQMQMNNNADDGDWYEPSQPLKNTRVLPQILPDHRANKPQPKSCGFLDRNVRFLNEPICNVYTKPVQHEERYWWPTRANPGELIIPPYAEDTNYRTDYNCRFGSRPAGSGRHTAHFDREAALGSVPVNYLRQRDGSQRFYKEGLSYEHMYNCRSDPNYPIRGKRHGAFVWSRMDPISQKKFIEYYEKLEEEEKRQNEKADLTLKSPTEKGTFIARSANNNNKSGASSPKRKLSSVSVQQKCDQQIANAVSSSGSPEVKPVSEPVETCKPSEGVQPESNPSVNETVLTERNPSPPTTEAIQSETEQQPKEES